jgi:radical SAM superfamily enzyme YgiQ (UPF0313 family)
MSRLCEDAVTARRILLADPPYRVSYKRYVIPNMGLAYLAATLRQAGHEVAGFSATLHADPSAAFAGAVREFAPDLVGFSAPTCKIVQAARLAAIARHERPEVKTVVGGWHLTATPKEAMRENAAFDFGLAGEAEDTLPALADALAGGDLAGIGGLLWREDDRLHVNDPAPLPDVASLPWPAWDLFDLDKSRPMYRAGGLDYPILAKRGCPFDCLFCKQDGLKTVRYRDLDDLLAEIHAGTERFGADGLQFFDETLALSERRTRMFCERFLADGLDRKLRWNIATRADVVKPDLLKLMARAGCRVVQMGIESGNQAVLDGNRKGVTLAQCRDAVRWCREAGLEPDLSFVFGLPFDDRHTVQESARFSRELDPDFVAYFTFIPYPGTPAGDLARQGQANLRLLHRDYENYEQQYSLPCELRDVPAWRLTVLRYVSYARFYFRPGKFARLRTMLDLRALPRILIDLVGNLIATGRK